MIGKHMLLKRCVGQRRTNRYRFGVGNPHGKSDRWLSYMELEKLYMVWE